MSRKLTLGPLTALSLSPARLLDAAAAAGFDGVGLRLTPAAPGGLAWPLMEDRALLRETLAAMRATGLFILDLEMVRIGPRFDVGAHAGLFAVGAELGAAHVLVAIDDDDCARATGHFAQVCEAARRQGLTADIEFMPWTQAPDLATALRIVEGAGQPNGGVLVDALHVARAGVTLDALRAVPRHLLHYAQLCDGPLEAPATVEGLIHAARHERLLPGEGGLPLRALLDVLPDEIPLCAELPHEKRTAKLGAAEWIRRCGVACREFIARQATPA
ncbi:MAG: sugar phosphate isomerase/epimerase [Burkholderiales bacterium]|nr:sugar phosphate isomerase/epimerase [Burkholderiales bacterium]